MKSIRCVFVLCLASVVLSVWGQDSGGPPCPFTADEVKSLNLNQIKSACGEFDLFEHPCWLFWYKSKLAPRKQHRCKTINELLLLSYLPMHASKMTFLILNILFILYTADTLTSSPSAEVCDACTAAIVRTFKSLIPKFNVPCDAAPSATQYTERAILVLFATCPNPIFSSLEGAGISIDKFGYLDACPDDGTSEQVKKASVEVCPSLPAEDGN